MCGWEEALAAVVSAAGTAVSAKGASDSASAMNAAADAQLAQQAQYQQQASKVFQGSLGTSGVQTAKKETDQGTAQALANQKAVQNVPLTLSSAAPAQQGTAEQQAQNQIVNQANAQNQGWSEYQLQQGIKNMLAKQNLGVIGGLAQSSANTLPLQLQSASQAGAGLQGLGSLLQTGGYLGGLYGATQPGSGLPSYINTKGTGFTPQYGVN